RDNRAFIAFAKKYGSEATLAEATDVVNELQVKHLSELVLKHLSSTSDESVSILGLAYKPNTPVIEESAGIKVIDDLIKKNVKITVYDPLAMDGVRSLFGDAIDYAESVKYCLSRSPFWIITTPLDEFKSLDDSFISHNRTTIIDCWRVIDPAKFQKKVKYVALGRSCEWST
ncbi:MAG: UDP binding domain-containing protein, partial [Bacteroidota bacterium]